jgi:phosphoesterase RecJ-like protein
MIAAVAQALRDARSVLITSHVNPDGDAIGSQLAFAEILQRLGKQVAIVNRDPPPVQFRALPAVAAIALGERAPAADTYLFLECSAISRSGLTGFADAAVKINIDHHLDNTSYGEVNWIDTDASSVGELAYRLLPALGLELSAPLATHLYLAISSDTGCFRYSNASPQVFAIGRELLLAGAERERINDLIFNSNSYAKIVVMGRVLQTMEREPDGQVIWSHILQTTIDELRATKDDLEGMVNLPLSIAGVEVAFFLKQTGPEQFKVSLRSRSGANVYQVAKAFGGGGHFHASGCTVAGNLETATARIRAAVDRELVRAGLRGR